MQVLSRLVRVLLFATLTIGSWLEVKGQQMPSAMETIAIEDSMRNAPSLELINDQPCIELEKPSGRGLTKVAIEKAGHYCLTEDLHARIEFADHPAEHSMIIMYTGNVVIDLQGHTLGRGRVFKNPGGIGIEIVDPKRLVKRVGLAKNIIIKNGVLQDFEIGIYFGYGRSRLLDTPTFDPKTNTYHFPADNITLKNITFKNNKQDFDIHVPREPKK